MTEIKEFVLATRNSGKIREMKALLSGISIVIRAATDFPGLDDVEETGQTLEQNARLKAEAVATYTGLPALADDTGLEVDALDGRPGVHSARFAGLDASDSENRTRLLSDLVDATNRRARFRTIIAWSNAGSIRYFEGICEGAIATAEQGTGGFGYDSLFVPSGYSETFAAMEPAVKNRISHRGRALEAFTSWLKNEDTDRTSGTMDVSDMAKNI